MPTPEATGDDDQPAAAPVAMPVAKRPWPSGLAEQIKAVPEVMAGSGRAMGLSDLEARFTARGPAAVREAS